jgi:hypothetical protein
MVPAKLKSTHNILYIKWLEADRRAQAASLIGSRAFANVGCASPSLIQAANLIRPDGDLGAIVSAGERSGA